MRSAMNQVPDRTASAYHQTVHLGASAVRIINGICLITSPICLIGLIWNLEAGKGWMTGAALPGLFLSLLVLLLNRFHKARYGLTLLLWSFAFLPIFSGMASYGLAAPGLVLVPVSILAASLLLSPRHGLVLAISCAALCCVFYWLTQQHYLPTSEPLPLVKLLALQGTLCAATLIGLLGAHALRTEFARVKRLVQSLEIKAGELQRAEAAQHQLNLELESRVEARTAELSLALEQLKRTQSDLVQSEKLAALGSMVAGIAHELNTPVGNVLMVASSLAAHQQDFERQMETGLTRTALRDFLASVHDVTSLMDRNLQRIANIVSTFKQVAVDQSIEHRRLFDLSELLQETTLTMGPTLRISGRELKIGIPPGMILDSYPGPLGQVILNLINNALKHAFDGRDKGLMQLDATALAKDWIRIEFSDNGIGIAAQNLSRIFDPFFTTKMGQGGSGLGLCIVHNIVTGMLGGRIEVMSRVGEGTCFRIDIPVVAQSGERSVVAQIP